jgi:Flp pilus assembly protein TadD
MDSSIRNSHLFGDAKATAGSSGGAQRKQQALTEAERRAQDNPTQENLRSHATALFELGMFAEAEKVFTEVMSRHGEEIQTLVDLGFTYKNLNRLEDAKRSFLRAAELAPKTNLARCAENEVWMIDPTYKPSWVRK